MKKLLLFDFDGTVIDGSAGIYNCIRYATDKMGLPPVQAESAIPSQGNTRRSSTRAWKSCCGI